MTTGPPLPDGFKTGGLPDPREAALQGFAADAHMLLAFDTTGRAMPLCRWVSLTRPRSTG